MAKLNWLDFSIHNESTGDNVRAFSVNHPNAGRLVVIKGISQVLKPAMQELEFTNTLDGSWVIKATNLNVGLLKDSVFPSLRLKEVALSEIDLTNQYVRSQAATEETQSPVNPYERSSNTNTALNWLYVSCRKVDQDYSQYEGILPAALAATLWDSISSSAKSTELPNGQTVYEGTFNDEFYLLVRRPQILAGPQRVKFYVAASSENLPNVLIENSKPVIFQLSDNLKNSATEIAAFYGHQIGVKLPEEFSASRSYAELIAQDEMNSSKEFEGSLLAVQIESKSPFVIASREYSRTVSFNELREAFGESTAAEIVKEIDSLNIIETAKDEPDSRSFLATDLVNLQSVIRAVIDRKGDSIAFYKMVDSEITGADPFISSNKTTLIIKTLPNTPVKTISTSPLINHSKVPAGYTLSQGNELRIGLVSLKHNDSGLLIRENDNAWFPSLTDAVKAIDLPENQIFVNPRSIDIDAALDEVFEDSELRDEAESNIQEFSAESNDAINSRYSDLIANINSQAKLVLSTGEETTDRVNAIVLHRESLIESLNETLKIVDYASKNNIQLQEYELIDLVDIGNPVISEIYNQLIGSDVPLIYSSLANEIAEAAEVNNVKTFTEYPKSLVELHDVLLELVEVNSFDECNIEIVDQEDGPVILHKGLVLEKLIGNPNREGVILTLINAIGSDKFLTPEFNRNLSYLNRYDYGDALSGAITNIFKGRKDEIIQNLLDQGFVQADSHRIHSPSGDSVITVTPKLGEDGQYVFSMKYSLGEEILIDELELSPKEFSEKLVKLVDEHERSQTTFLKVVPATTQDLFAVNESNSNIDQVQSPTLSSKSDIIYSNGSNRNSFMVSGNGLLLLNQKLKEMGGTYVKSLAAYKFKKIDEERVRKEILMVAESMGLTIHDGIRTNLHVEEGVTFSFNGVDYKILSITASFGDEPNIEVLELSSNKKITNTRTSYLSDFQRKYDVFATNYAELVSEFQSKKDADKPKVNPEKSASLISAAIKSVESGEFNDALTTIRGETVELVGRNQAGEELYATNSGRRFRIVEGSDRPAIAENPEILYNGQIVAPRNREHEFKTLAELSSDVKLSSNVISLTRQNDVNDDESPNYTEEEFYDLLAKVGLTPSILSEYFQAKEDLILYEIQADKSDPSYKFTYKRLELEIGKKFQVIENAGKTSGFAISEKILAILGESQEEAINRIRDTVARTYITYNTNHRLNEIKSVSVDDALSLSIKDLRAAPPKWIHTHVENSINRGDDITALLLIAKAYGTADEVNQVTAIADKADESQVSTLLNDLQLKYKKDRILAEAPALISEDAQILNEDSTNYFRRSVASDRLDANRKLYADALYGISEFKIDESDIETYKVSGSVSEFIDSVMEKYQFSYDAAKLYEQRIDEEITRRVESEFLQAPETKILLETAIELRKSLPEGIEVDVSEKPGNCYVRFTYGAGKVTVSRPNYDSQDEGYEVHYRYSADDSFQFEYERTGGCQYKTLPSAEQICQDTLSFIAQSYTKTKLYNAPSYGSKFSDGPNRYNVTAIAKSIREDIKAAIANGNLPKGVKVSVRKDNHSIYATITNVPDDLIIFNPDYAYVVSQSGQSTPPPRGMSRYSHDAIALQTAIGRYVNAYNFDKSDPFTDYYNTNYYAHISFDRSLVSESYERALEIASGNHTDEFNQLRNSLETAAIYHAEDFNEMGFVYIDGIRRGLQFTNSEHRSIDGEQNAVQDLRKILTENGVTVHESIPDYELLGLSAMYGIYSSQGKSIFTGVAEQSFEPDLVLDIENKPAEIDSKPVRLNHVEVTLSNDETYKARIGGLIEGLGEGEVIIEKLPSLTGGRPSTKYELSDQDGFYSVAFDVAVPSGEYNGAIISVTNADTVTNAYKLAAQEIEKYLLPIYEARSPINMADALVILNDLETIIGAHKFQSNLITDKERAIAAQGLEAIQAYFVDPDLLERKDVVEERITGLSGFLDTSAEADFCLRTHSDSTYTWGINLIIDSDTTVHQSIEHSPKYPTEEEAVRSFLRALHATGSVSPDVIDGISEFITGSVLNYASSPAQVVDLGPANQILKEAEHEGEVVLAPNADKFPRSMGLESRLIVVGPNSEEVKAYILDTYKIDSESRLDVSDVALTSGGIIDGHEIHFSKEENLRWFKNSTGSTLRISDTDIVEVEKWDTSKTVAPIDAKQTSELELLGLVKTHLQNTWLAYAFDKSLCQIQYFRGEVDTIEALVSTQIDGYDNAISVTGIPSNSTGYEIIDRINQAAGSMGIDKLLVINEAPVISELSEEQSAQVLIGAGLSMNQSHTGSTIVGGETARHRRLLSLLGGNELPSGEWHFDSLPKSIISQILSRDDTKTIATNEGSNHVSESNSAEISATGQNVTSPKRVKSDMAGEPVDRSPIEVVSESGRGSEPVSRQNRRSDRSSDANDIGRSSPASSNDQAGATFDDGQLRPRSVDFELFDLGAAKASLTTTDHAQLSLDAIETLLRLRAEQRQATPEEKIALSGMVGLGSSVFNTGGSVFYASSNKSGIQTPKTKLSKLLLKLSYDERDSLKATILTGFYTPKFITDFMWSGLEKMGMKNISRPLDIVDPALGTGNFIGGAPDYVRRNSNIHGIEADTLTSEIASHLYPEIRVMNQEFQTVLYAPESKDLIIGNPPYSDVRTFNPNTGKREVLHDLFLRESIKAIRQGGVVAFVTSSGTLDKQNESLRADIYRTSDLVLAIRLPSSAFKEESGTEVMTDILFFRKRKHNEEPLSGDWVKTVPYEHGGETELVINKYFVDHPEHVHGDLTVGTNQFGPVVKCLDNGIDVKLSLPKMLSYLPENTFNPSVFRNITTSFENGVKSTNITILGNELTSAGKVGELILDKEDNLKIIRYNSSEANYFTEDAPIPTSQHPIARAYVRLRDTARALIDTELAETTENSQIKADELRSKLNDLYDTFFSNFGSILKKENSRILRADPSFYFASQLEIHDKTTGNVRKADIFTKRIVNQIQKPEITNSMDAVYRSMSDYGYIEPEYVSELMGKDWDSILPSIEDSIFFDPKLGKYLTESIYLSGDVIEKIEFAKRALADRPELERNIEALKQVIPTKIPITSIRIKIGATWIPEDALTKFVRSTLNLNTYSTIDKCYVTYNDKLKSWNFKITDMIIRDTVNLNTVVHGTAAMPFHKLFKHCLEQTRPTIYYTDDNGNSHVDEQATQLARDKQNQIEERFVEFVLADHNLAESLESSYNYKMNRWVLNNPDGKYLTFPGITETIKGRPFKHGSHQLAVIERALTSEHGMLIAHEAGGGKTISTVSILMKAKQLGLAKKPLIAVPNHMLVQYTLEALDLYPNARILTVNKDDLTREGREQFAYKSQLNDWDLVICTHEQFTKMRMPASIINKSIEDEISELKDLLEESKGDRKTAKQLERQIKSLKEKLNAEIFEMEKNKDEIDFTTLGIDYVGYDEAHYLKNRAFPTKNSNLAGVQSLTSQRARDAELKFDWIREYRGDSKGVLLATGTPISNTIGEIMVMLRYTAPELLKNAGIHNFDDFIATFGETKVHVELTADGSSYQLKERLSGFHNIPELMRIFSQVADIKMGDQLDLKRPESRKVTRVSEMSPEQYMFMDWLSERAAKVKNRLVDPSKDNMLNIYTDLQTISVDPRLYHHKLQDFNNSKVNMEVRDIVDTWKQGHENKETQLIFIDRYQKTSKHFDGFNPKTKKQKIKTTVDFNLIDDMTDKLVALGIPREQIGSIHDTKSDDDKEEFFSKIRNGDVRIVFASTAKMGVGTNVQTRGKHLRHLTYPMRSIDVEQRNKRFVRQGNMNSEVYLHYPTTKDSGDLSLLQMIDRKDQMTKQIMSCDFENMARSYEENFSPSYEDIMAITTGNSAIKEKLQLDSELDKLYRLRKSHNFQCYELRKQARSIVEKQIPEMEIYISDSKKLANAIRPDQLASFSMKVNGNVFNKVSYAGAEIHRAAAGLTLIGQRKTIGSFLGADLELSLNKGGVHTISIEIDKVKLSASVTESIQTFPNLIGNIVKTRISGIQAAEEKLNELRKQAEDYEAMSKLEFKYQARILEVEQNLAKVNADLAEFEASRPAPSKDSVHPFEKLLRQINGNNEDGGEVITNNILSESQLQEILDNEHKDSQKDVNHLLQR